MRTIEEKARIVQAVDAAENKSAEVKRHGASLSNYYAWKARLKVLAKSSRQALKTTTTTTDRTDAALMRSLREIVKSNLTTETKTAVINSFLKN